MKKPLLRGLHLAGQSLWYLFAILVLLLALAYGATRQGLHWLERNPDKVAAWLSKRAGQPVAFSRLEATWTRRGPLLQLDELEIGRRESRIPMGQVEVLVAPYTGWLPGRRLTELRLHGLELTLERNADGQWQVRGLPGDQAGGGNEALDALQSLGELQVIAGRLQIVGLAAVPLQLPRVDVRLQADAGRIRAGVRAWPQAGTSPLEGRLDFDRNSGNGRFYLSARQLDLADWSDWLQWQGVALAAGKGRVEVWLSLQDNKVESISSVSDLQDVALSALHPVPGAARRVQWQRWQLGLHFLRDAEGWRLHLPRLNWTVATREVRMDGIRARKAGEAWAVEMPYLPLGDLLALTALSDVADTGLRHWIGRARPEGTLHALRLAGQGRRISWLEGEARALGFLPVGDAPGLSGLGGRFSGDHDGAVLHLERPQMVFDWPRGFGVKHPIRVQGTVAAWREGQGVRFGSGHLDVAGEGYRAQVRGGMWFQNDGTLPWIDIAADLDEAEVPVARKFWIRHLMPAEAVQWLDMALVGGKVRNARAIASGDLDDWPFTRHNGRFEAVADIEQGQLRFQQDWPPIRAARLKAAFIGDGMEVVGQGTLGGVRVENLSARIAHFDRGELEIRAQGRGDAGQFLQVLRQSPLNATLADTLSRLEASGPVGASFSLHQPLYHGGPPTRIAGEVALQGATLGERELQLRFSDVRGSASYTQSGFHADRLAVTHEGQRGELSLRAGAGHVALAGNAFEGVLAGELSAASLLQKAPDMAWLKPWLSGRSHWSVEVALPAGSDAAQAVPSRLLLRSDLQGTAIKLPAPLEKAAAASLPVRIQLPLPLESGEVEISLGQRLGLRARAAPSGRLGIRATFGSAVADGPAPLQGLQISGRATEIDALGWAGLLAGTEEGSSLGAVEPVQVDVRAGQLQLMGQRFADTRLKITPQPQATRIELEGARLAGHLLLPKAAGATLNANLSRLDLAFAAAKGATNTAATGGVEIAPAKVPPLAIAVQDLRLNGKPLGRLQLQTRPVADGMQIHALTLDAAATQVRMAGHWRGQSAARSRFSGQVESRDFGSFLAALGLPGQMRGGEGQVRLDLAWPGAPADFSPARLQGEMAATLKDGQLIELEPGAGRLLGLLSVARLPQRLTLDFRDFFDKGFAFDRIEGQVLFADGRARAEGLYIEGPAARIDIAGSADLAAETFDQSIEVRPRTGNLLTVAGAIAAGPVGAAVGAVANAVLKKPLSEVGAKRYRVTGPWDNPKVEVRQRQSPALAAADDSENGVEKPNE